MKKLQEKVDRFASKFSLRFAKWRFRMRLYRVKAQARLIGCAVSAFAIGTCAALLAIPNFRMKLDGFQPLEAVLSAIGATYGTILALVLTLSVIPIQRAAEVWSSSIMRLYRRDRATYFMFVGLSICCVVSFALSVRGLFEIPVSVVIAASLTAIGINLDVLRWYHGHICRLLEPTHSIGLALKEAHRSIDSFQVRVARVSLLQFQLLDADQRKNVTRESIETLVYPQLSGYPGEINSWTADLSEIATRAVTRGEKEVARVAVLAIGDITNHYLTSRKLNLRVTADSKTMFLAKISDVDVVTNRAYEALQDVSAMATAHADEVTAIRVSEAFQRIAIHTAQLDAPSFRDRSAPLTYAPLHYAFECVKRAQAKGLDEVAFQSVGVLEKVSEAAPKGVDASDIHIPVIEGISQIVLYFYVKNGGWAIAESANGAMFRILAQLLHQQDSGFMTVLRRVLEKVESLAFAALVNEAAASRLSMIYPLNEAYGLENENSIGYLIEAAAISLPREDGRRDWINPYHEFIDVVDVVSDHLRRVAEANDFNESFLLWQINQSIKHIAKVIEQLISHPLRADRGDEADLAKSLKSILSFYWVAFRDKKAVSGQRADECCEALMMIGLLFLNRQRPDVLKNCVSNIQSIIESYCRTVKSVDNYKLGDLFAYFWGIRLLLVARHDDVSLKGLDEKLANKPEALNDRQWGAAQEAMMLRRGQLEERLREDRRGFGQEGENLLGRLLEEARGKNSSPPV